MRSVARALIMLVLWIVLGATGCATIRDTREGMESGTSRIVSVPPDSAWVAMVSVMRDYPTEEADEARGVLVTRWAEQLVPPDAFSQHHVVKERTRFELAVAPRDAGSRVSVRYAVEFLARAYTDQASSDQQAFCQDPWPESVVGPSQKASSLYYTSQCTHDNPWVPRGNSMYVWRRVSQVVDPPATGSSEREQAILDAIEGEVRRGAGDRQQTP